MKFVTQTSRFIVRAALVAGVLSCSFGAVAQTTAAAAAVDEPESTSFPGEAQATLHRLQSLKDLPVGEWRFHAGDMPHGESTTLDDHDWPTIKMGMSAPAEATWYRLKVTMPAAVDGYSMQGTRVMFQFKVRYHGPITQIIYFNGRRVAMGEDLEPIELFRDAKAGESVEIAVKLPRGDDVKRYIPSFFTVEFDPKRPSPEQFRAEVLTASALSPLAANQEFLNRAVAAVKWSSLKTSQAAFDTELKQAEAMLQPLKEAVRADTVDLVGNSHIDAAWLWPASETIDVVRRTFTTSLQLMHEYPEYKYTQSAAAYSEWMQEKYPVQFQEIKERVAEKRWEIVGGMWVEPDLNMPDGESMVRQLLVGKRWFRQNLGTDVKIGWNPDSFGYTWQLPQIYKKSGVDFFVTQKMKWNDTNQLPLKSFWWESPDGSRVLAYFPHDYARGTEPLRLASDFQVAKKLAPGTDTLMHLYGVGDHGGGPTRVMIDQAIRWSDPALVYPTQHFVLAGDFFSRLQGQVSPAATSPVWDYKAMAKGLPALPKLADGRVSIPVWHEEMYFEYHRGIYTSQAQHKKHMRESEEWMLNAEKYASLAWLGGAAYPSAALNEAWKKVLFNQFHDLAAGSGIAVIYKDAERDYAAVKATTDDVSAASKKLIDEHIDTGAQSGTPIVVFNPLAWPRTDVIETDVQLAHANEGGVQVLDERGNAVPLQVLSSEPATGLYHVMLRPEVPPLGYTVLHASAGNKSVKTELQASANVLENKWLRAEVDRSNGCIMHLVDKRTGFDAIAPGGCGDQLQIFRDTPKEYDAWNIDPGTLDQAPTLLSAVDSMELVDKGPLKATLRITRHWQSSKFVQDITLIDGADTLAITNDIDWHEHHVLLKTAFPLAASSGAATYEIPFGTIDRPTTRDNEIEKAKFEVPAIRWADLGDGQHGLSLLNESKYGYDAAGNVLRLSLLRGSTYPDPEMDQGHHHFTFALYPHAGRWDVAETMHRGYELNYKLQAWQSSPHAGMLGSTGSFFGMDTPGVTLTAVKKSEDGNGLVLRVYEWDGKAQTVRLRVPVAPQRAGIANMMEEATGENVVVEGKTLVFPIKPFEIVTVRLDFAAPPTELWR